MSFSDRLFQFARENELLDHPKMDGLLKLAAVAHTEQQMQEVMREATLLAREHQKYPFKDNPPPVSLLDNVVLLGKTLRSGAPVAIREEDLVLHTGFYGQSGAGKTTSFRNIMSQLTTPYWAFDRKQDYRHMALIDPNLLVLPWTELKFNPLKPPEGVPPVKWAQVFAEIFSHATDLLSGSKNYLLKNILELYLQYNLFREVSPPYPSLFELLHLMDSEKINFVRKTANYRDTVVNRVEPMILAAGSVFDCSEGYPIEELMKRRVVFEFEGLNRDIQNFLQEILFAYAYEHQIAENRRTGDLVLLIFIDEAKQLFSFYKERQDAQGIPEIDDLTARARQFGLGIVVADQEASKLTDSIKANTNTTVLLPVGDAKQFDEVADSMNLTEFQRVFAQSIETGEAIIQIGNREPVPVDMYNFELPGTISIEELHKCQEGKWAELDSMPRQEVKFPSQEAELDPDEVAESSQEKPEIEISEDAQVLIRDVVENPFTAITERYESKNLSYHKGNEAKNELIEKDLVEEVSVPKGDSRIKLLEISRKGAKFLDSQGIEFQRKSRGGIEHRYWQENIREWLMELGWVAKVETFDADVYGNNGTEELVVEVAMSSADREIEHVEDRVEKGFDHVIVACRNQNVKEKLRQKLEDSSVDESSAEFRVLPELLDSDLVI